MSGCIAVSKWSRYRPGVAQRMGRGIALLFHDRGTRRGWVVSPTHRPHFTPGKDPVPILQEAGWAPGPVWTGGKSRPYRHSIPDRPTRSSVAIPTELPGPFCGQWQAKIMSSKHEGGDAVPQCHTSHVPRSVNIKIYQPSTNLCVPYLCIPNHTRNFRSDAFRHLLIPSSGIHSTPLYFSAHLQSDFTSSAG